MAVHKEEATEEFYEKLRNAKDDVPAHNFLIVMGDFNARLGPDKATHTYHDTTNRNGQYMAEILTEFGLLAAKTMIQKRKGTLDLQGQSY